MRGRPKLDVGTYGRISSRGNPPNAKAWCRFRDLDGVTRVVTATGRSRFDAEQRLKRKLSDRVAPADHGITADTKVSALAAAWLADVERSDRAIQTKQRYAEVVALYVLPAVGGLTLRECTPHRLNGAVQKLADTKGDATAKVTRSVLSGMFRVAFANGAVTANPVRDVKVVTKRAKPRALTVEQVRDMLAGLRADDKAVRADLPDLVSVLAATGVRFGEALALRWADLDLTPGDGHVPTATIRGTVVRIKGEGLVIQDHAKGKADDDALVLGLPSWVVPVLMRRKLAALPNAHGVVFPSAANTLRDPCNARDQWRAARDRLGLESWVTPHVIRKAVATAVASAKGADAAAEQLGHADDQVTRAHYIDRARRADHREVVEQFDPSAEAS
ncbi:tyrosine-type recombinase/integrase [Gordonia sp. NPDC003422]